MAIRIREIGGTLVALCAARTVEQEGDIYLHDGIHHALSMKFWRDWAVEEGRMDAGGAAGCTEWKLIEQVEDISLAPIQPDRMV